MKKYTVFDAQTGAVLSQGEDGNIAIQAGPGQIVREGHWDAETYTLSGGRPVRRSSGRRGEAALVRLWRERRIERGRLLRRHVDAITVVQWSMMSPAEQEEVIAYRQALLDIPQTQTDPRNINWPDPPGRKGGSDG